jgi:hypothetical protein
VNECTEGKVPQVVSAIRSTGRSGAGYYAILSIVSVTLYEQQTPERLTHTLRSRRTNKLNCTRISACERIPMEFAFDLPSSSQELRDVVVHRRNLVMRDLRTGNQAVSGDGISTLDESGHPRRDSFCRHTF